MTKAIQSMLDAPIMAPNQNNALSIELGVESVYTQSSRFNRELSPTTAPATNLNDLKSTENPIMRCEFRVSHQALNDDRHAVTLTFVVTAEQKSQTLYHAEISQTGIFVIKFQDSNQQKMIKHLTNGYCPSILYPFVRQKLQDMVVSANFPAVQLPIINFELEHRKRQQQSDDQVILKDMPVASIN